MDILLTYWNQALSYWDRLPLDVRWYIWAGTGLAVLACFLVWSYGWMRRLMGHRKHLGTWYNEEQYATYMTMLDERSKSFTLQNADMIALRQWKHGDVKSLSGDKSYGGYL